MFDFAPVGAAITLAGIAFITLVGWRLTPKRGEDSGEDDKLFSVGDYLTELKVPEGSSYAGATLHNLLSDSGEDKGVVVLALIRDDKRQLAPSTYRVLKENDLLLVESDTESLQAFLDNTGLELGSREDEEPDTEKKGKNSKNLKKN